MPDALIDGADWPLFGWIDDTRPGLAAARFAGRNVVLATLYRVEGSAPRGAGAQMLFDGTQASGYFSGDCIEGDVARHAAEVMADGQPRHLHYGMGSPWIDIRLRCGGALYVLLERIGPDCAGIGALLAHGKRREPCRTLTNGTQRSVVQGGAGALLTLYDKPFEFSRRHDPARRLIVSGGDPGALALACLASQAGFDTVLVRPDGPAGEPPFAGTTYLRCEPEVALDRYPCDAWTAYVGATHEDHHDLAACLKAVRQGAAYVGMIGARTRATGRMASLKALGASDDEIDGLHFSPGIAGLGKAPWEVATGIMAEVMQAMRVAQNLAAG